VVKEGRWEEYRSVGGKVVMDGEDIVEDGEWDREGESRMLR
jgi:hypothetical protein